MDIFTGDEGIPEALVLSKPCQHHQLDLGIVSTDEYVSFSRDEGASDQPSFIVSHRNILEIGITGRKTASCCSCLEEGGMDPAFLIHKGRQHVNVGALQLRKQPILEKVLHYWVTCAPQPFQRCCICGISSLGLLSRRKAPFIKKKLGKLECGVDIEFIPSFTVDPFGQRGETEIDILLQLLHLFLRQKDSGPFHSFQNSYERHLHGKIGFLEILFMDSSFQDPGESENIVCSKIRVSGLSLQGQGGYVSSTNYIFNGKKGLGEISGYSEVQGIDSFVGVHHPGFNHSVAIDLQVKAQPMGNMDLVLCRMADHLQLSFQVFFSNLPKILSFNASVAEGYEVGLHDFRGEGSTKNCSVLFKAICKEFQSYRSGAERESPLQPPIQIYSCGHYFICALSEEVFLAIVKDHILLFLLYFLFCRRGAFTAIFFGRSAYGKLLQVQG